MSLFTLLNYFGHGHSSLRLFGVKNAPAAGRGSSTVGLFTRATGLQSARPHYDAVTEKKNWQNKIVRRK